MVLVALVFEIQVGFFVLFLRILAQELEEAFCQLRLNVSLEGSRLL